jgi:hypothetical protein
MLKCTIRSMKNSNNNYKNFPKIVKEEISYYKPRYDNSDEFKID